MIPVNSTVTAEKRLPTKLSYDHDKTWEPVKFPLKAKSVLFKFTEPVKLAFLSTHLIKD